jgi:hypothetical protein
MDGYFWRKAAVRQTDCPLVTIVCKVDNRTTPKISRKLIVDFFACFTFQRHMGPVIDLDEQCAPILS